MFSDFVNLKYSDFQKLNQTKRGVSPSANPIFMISSTNSLVSFNR
ncbi:hypothetical protein SAMN04488508_109233 [Aquimarina spongiae]|uniref:Uncharacterized protein n=1 Tax=Aquimarina spongiae TaxID=570521 RepID=A0A1M6JT31_9FLAO|nr:hypothetical protein SAMN04488508_109233 [Aquimarina spongiae]